MSDIVKLSPSAVESYDRCNWNYYLTSRCGYKPHVELHNQVGSASHEFVAGIHKAKVRLFEDPEDPNPRFDLKDGIYHHWHPFWIKHLQTTRNVHVPKHMLEHLKDEGSKIGPQYIESYLSHPRVRNIRPENVEVEYKGVHIPGTSVDLSVRIDQIRRSRNGVGDLLVDLKFSNRKVYNPKENFALRCYALVYRQVFGTSESGVVIWHVPSGIEAGISTAQLSDKDLYDTVNRLRITGLNILHRKFNLPKDVHTCATCQTKQMCKFPHLSTELVQLARRNTNFKGPLPRNRSEIIAEGILEPPDGKPIHFHDTQGTLELN